MKILGFEITRQGKELHIKKQRRSSGDKLQRMMNTRSYDAAATTRHNENHWLYADASDADALIRPGLPTLRNRARYEVRNNSYAEGIIDTLVNETVSTGSDLQFQSGEGEDADNEVEQKFYQWMLKCDIEGKLPFGDIQQLAGVRQQAESGEGLIVMTNAAPQKSWVRANREPQLRLRVVEPDRLATPLGMIMDDKIRDGIECDEDGRPAFYYILKRHPGSALSLGNFGDYDKVPASQVIHLYRIKRPGQSRGVPWVTPALTLFAQLRRYTLATIQAAETAANVSGTIETEGQTDADDIEIGDEVEIERNTFLTLHPGGKLGQLKPEHPATTYEMFKKEIINEIGRCINMPFNIAAANSSKYNYASGRLDHQSFNKFKKTIRGWLELGLNNRVLFAWLREALLIPGYFKYYTGRNLATTIPQWNWPDSGHVDPLKEARGQQLRLQSLTTNLKTEYAALGKDWEQEIEQRKKEIDKCRELGILDEAEAKSAMEDIARAVRAGVPIGVSEARASMGFPEEPPSDKLLRFNDQDVLQCHIENGVLLVNEVRGVLGLPPVPWGNVPVRKTGVKTVSIKSGETDKEDEDETETDIK